MSESPSSGGFISGWIKLLGKIYWLVIIAAGVASYFAFQLAAQLKLDTDIASLMPDGVPSVINLDKVIQKTGGYSSVNVVVVSPDPAANILFLDALREKVIPLEWVSSAEYAEDTEIFKRHQLLYVDEEDLSEVSRRLQVRLDYEKGNIDFNVEDIPVSITIRGEERDEVPSLDFSDIEAKYRQVDSSQEDAGGDDRHLFTDDTGEVAILVVLPGGSTTGIGYSRGLLQTIQELVDEIDPESYNAEMQVDLGGRVRNRVEEFDAILSDLKSSAIWSIGAILLGLILFYRRIMALIYIGVPLVMGFLWTFGITQVVLGGLNLVTVFLVLILFGLGIDFGIHNLTRYEEARRFGKSWQDALFDIYNSTGRASIMAAMTTVFAFYALMVTDFRAFYEFGFISGTGVALALVSMYLVFPSLMILAEKIRLYRVPAKKLKVRDIKADQRFKSPGVWLLGGIAVTGVAIYYSTQLQFEDDFSKLRADMSALEPMKVNIRKVFPLATDRAVVFVESIEDVAAVVEQVEDNMKSDADVSTIEQVQSIYTIVPDSAEQAARLAVIEKIQLQLDEAAILIEDFGEMDDGRLESLARFSEYVGIGELQPDDLPEALKLVYTGVQDSGGYLVYIYNSKGTSKLDEAQAFVDDIREIKANGKTFYPATEAMIFVDMLNLMRGEAVTSVAAVLTCIIIMLLLVYRNIKNVAMTVMPITIGMVLMFGIMGAFGIKLNIFNMIVLPTVLGIGIDNAIHILHRYQEEGKNNVMYALKTTGGAAFMTTLTTMFGFAGMLSASNAGLKSLGLVACIGLTCCMVASLTIFPALLQWVENLSERSDAKRASRANIGGPAVEAGP
jgi:predicted RND superfamily exporter protein